MKLGDSKETHCLAVVVVLRLSIFIKQCLIMDLYIVLSKFSCLVSYCSKEQCWKILIMSWLGSGFFSVAIPSETRFIVDFARRGDDSKIAGSWSPIMSSVLVVSFFFFLLSFFFRTHTVVLIGIRTLVRTIYLG